jgi:Enoyl-(Acyl carrier protein) reductase
MREDVDDFFGVVIAGQRIRCRGDPDDVADAVAYLGSESSEFVTGQSLSVGGGDRFPNPASRRGYVVPGRALQGLRPGTTFLERRQRVTLRLSDG